MEQTIALLRIALGVITDRLLTILSLTMTFALAAWAMNAPDPQREGMAGFFALAVFIPCIVRERPKKEKVYAPAPNRETEAD